MDTEPKVGLAFFAGFDSSKAPGPGDILAARLAACHSAAQAAALLHFKDSAEWVRLEEGSDTMGLALWELYLHKARLLPKPPPAVEYSVAFDPNTGHTAVSVDVLPQINPDKALFPMKPPTAPDAFCLLVGQISIAWSDLEDVLEAVLEVLFAHQGCSATKHLMFEARKTRVLGLCEEIFVAQPNVVEHVRLLLGTASALQKERNLLAHGQKAFRVRVDADGKGGASVCGELLVTGRYEGTRQTIAYSLDKLESIFYVLCHLSKRLEDLVFASSSETRGVKLPQADMDAMDKVFGFV